MAIEIYDAGASLKLVSGTQVRYVMKQAIRELTVIKSDTILKIDVGGGALNNIFILFTDITFPVLASAAQVRDYINNNWLGPLDTGSKLTQLANTGDKILAEMQLLHSPLVSDDNSPYLIYEGFASPATATNAAEWAIRRISKGTTQTIVQWANGNRNFTNVWDNRATLAYS